jgi:CheY-like chemotaxis protein
MKEDFSELVKMKLEDADITTWKAPNNIMAGKEWRDEIDAALLDSHFILVILDENSVNSPYVTYEWAFALGNKKPIIPILVDDCKVHPRISVLQYLDFRGKNRPWNDMIRLIKSIEFCRKDTIKVSDLTVEELEEILARSKALVNTSDEANKEDMDVASMVNKLANAKSNFQDVLEKTNTILWVDDRPNNNIYERQAFESIGFHFDLALSTDEALTLFNKNNYIAIISDMGRKEGSREGYVLLREIRKTNKHIPYFIYASSNLLEHKIEAQEKGAQGSTSRPHELIDLVLYHI